jgi:hypothetical protein
MTWLLDGTTTSTSRPSCSEKALEPLALGEHAVGVLVRLERDDERRLSARTAGGE